MTEVSNKKTNLNGGSKAKKSKTENVRSAIGTFLKQKNYGGTDKFRKSELSLLQNKKQFLMQKMIESDLHDGNCFAYSNVVCLTNNQQIVDQQFTRFVDFVELQDNVINSQLKRFYGPMICHFFLELMKARESKAAGDFLKKYAHLVAPVDLLEIPIPTKINGCAVANESNNDSNTQGLNIRFSPRESNSSEDPELEFFINLIQILSSCTKMETIDNEPEVCQFRSSKYEIHTTESVVNALTQYLQNQGHVLILNLLNTWIHVHIVDNELNKWMDDKIFFMPNDENDIVEPKQKQLQEKSSIKRITDESSNKQGFSESQNEKDEFDTEDNMLKKRMLNISTCLETMTKFNEKMKKCPSEVPRIIKLSDKSRGLTSAHIDHNECHLVAGFNNSSVVLWQMNQQRCKGKNLYTRFEDSLCPWELNNFTSDNEDEIDRDIRRCHTPKNTLNRRSLQYFKKKYEDNSFNEYGGINLRGHALGVTDVRFSTHYSLLYSVSKDSTMRCWRSDTLSCAGVYTGHRYPIWCVDESPLNTYVVTGSKDLTARLWSLEREFPLITYAGHSQDVDCVAFHPNGNYIATASNDLSVRFWCVSSGKLMRIFYDCKLPISSISFSPDGRMLAVGGEESRIRIFDLAAGAQLNELKDHSSTVTSLAWNSNSKHIASVCKDGSLRVWDVKKLTPMQENSNSSSSSSSTINRVSALNSNCQHLVRVLFSRNNTLCCIGS